MATKTKAANVQGAPDIVVEPSRNNVQMTHLSQRQYAALWPLQQQLEACEHRRGGLSVNVVSISTTVAWLKVANLHGPS